MLLVIYIAARSFYFSSIFMLSFHKLYKYCRRNFLYIEFQLTNKEWFAYFKWLRDEFFQIFFVMLHIEKSFQ